MTTPVLRRRGRRSLFEHNVRSADSFRRKITLWYGVLAERSALVGRWLECVPFACAPSVIADCPELESRPARSAEAPFATELIGLTDALYDFASYLSRDPVAAEDLVQEAFAR